MGKLTQEKQILEHMQKHGAITPHEALAKHGCFRLAARIKDLRDKGYDIRTDIRYSEFNARYAAYTLVCESAESP